MFEKSRSLCAECSLPGAFSYEHADATAFFQQTTVDEGLISAADGERIDSLLGGNLPDGGRRFAFLEIAISQFIYLVLFSYTFFFKGFTGLAITILCIATLFVVMQFTGKVDWEAIFQKKKGSIK